MKKFILLILLALSSKGFSQTTTFSQDATRYYLDNGLVKIGFDRRMGGTISWFEKKSDGRNLINNHDAGRQAGFESRIYPENQAAWRPYPNSLYLSEVFPGSGGASKEWNGLPQGSFYNQNYANLAHLGLEPETVDFNTTTKVLYIKVKLWEWGFVNNDAGNYTKIDAGAYNEYWIQLNNLAAEITLKQTRNIPYASDLLTNGASVNVFTNVNYAFSTKWQTYNENSPFTNQAVQTRTSFGISEPNYGNFWNRGTEHWVALTDNNNFGMGVYCNDNRLNYMYAEKQYGDFCVGSLPCTDEYKYSFGTVSMSTYSFPCGQPCATPNSTTEINFSLIAGNISEIRNYAYSKNPVTCSPPVPTIGSSSPSCNGNTLHLTSTGGTNYSWTGPNNFTSTVQNPQIPNVTPTNQGIYTVTVSTGSCSATATTNVLIGSITGANASSSSPICSGNSLNLSASGGTNYLWSGPNGFTSTAKNPTIVATNIDNQGIYTVTVTSLGCQLTLTATTNVVINQNVATSVGSNSPICVGSNINLSASGGTSYLWTGPNGFSSSLQSPIVSNSASANAGVYTVVLTNGLCTEVGTANVIINTLPTPPVIGSNLPICTNNSLNLSASGGTNYLWTGPNNFSSTQQNPTINQVGIAHAGTYTLSVTNLGCNSAATSTILINPSSSPSPSLSSSSAICSGGTINLTATNQAQNTGNQYQWDTPRGFSSSNQNIIIASANSNDGGIYTLTITNSMACTSTSTTAVTVHSNTTTLLSSNSPICSGKTLNISSSAIGNSYSWTGPNNFSATTQNLSISSIPASASGDYYLTIFNAGGCSSTAMISVFIKVTTALPLTTNSPICSGNSLNFTTIPAQGGNSYVWSGPNSFTSSQANPSISYAQPNATGTYFVTLTNINGCTSTAISTVNVRINPILLVVNNAPVCQGKTVNLSASNTVSLTGNTYLWKLPNGFSSNNQNIILSNASPAENGVYTVTLTNSVGCTATATTPVVINQLPVISTQSNSPTCIGTTLSMSANGGGTYVWKGPNAFSSTNQIISFEKVVAANEGTYSITVTSGAGCTSTANLSVFTKVTSGLTAVSNSPLCDGVILTLYSTEVLSNQINKNSPFVVQNSNTYLWSGPNSFSSTLHNPMIQSFNDLAKGIYTITLTNINGCTTTATTSVTNYQFLTQPQDNLICNNASSLTVSTNIPNATYQWQVKLPNSSVFTNITNSTDFGGVNSATLTLNSTNNSYNGATFQCIVSGTHCAMTSNSAILRKSTGSNSTLTNDLSSGTIIEYHDKISSTSKISGTANVTYKAEKSVILNPGFKAEVGAIFVAKIEGCN